MKSLKKRRDTISTQKYQEAAQKLNEIYSQEKIFWKQGYKQLWLSEGDQNNKFFHNAAKTRCKSNQIHTLVSEGGNAVGWENGLEDMMIEYFKSLFSGSQTEWSAIFEGVSR